MTKFVHTGQNNRWQPATSEWQRERARPSHWSEDTPTSWDFGGIMLRIAGFLGVVLFAFICTAFYGAGR